MGIGRVGSAARLAAFLFLFPGLLAAEGAGSVCARVKIQLKQEAIMARTAFDAGLRVDNSEGDVPVPNLAVELQIDDITEDPMVTLTPQEVEERFYIAPPDLGGDDGMDRSEGIARYGYTALVRARFLFLPGFPALTGAATIDRP